ncbi:MAG: peptidoglycan-binding protein [Pseudonocardiaceae bacterium]
MVAARWAGLFTAPAHAADPQPMRRRRIVALAVVGACAIAFVVGLIALMLMKSPEQQLADSSAPPASVITAPVELKIVTSTVVTRGRVTASSVLEVTPTSALGASVLVVTEVRTRAGDEVAPGQVLLAVSGRPLIALPGAVPAYRDLKPGDSGADVVQLQAALTSLGYATGEDASGVFGSGTKAAVQRLYEALGYQVPNTDGLGGRDDGAALNTARAAEKAAEGDVTAMKRRIVAGQTAGPGEEPLGDQLARLERRLAELIQDRIELTDRTGPMLPLNEVVFVPAFPARVAAFPARVGNPVTAPLITLSAGRLEAPVRLQPDQAALVRPGMPATLISEQLGQQASGVMASVGEVTVDAPAPGTAAPGGGAPGAAYHPATVTPQEPLPAHWSGYDVQVSITAARTEQPVLVVPLSAISADADGRTTVVVVGDAGRLTRREVRAGVSGNGFVQVEPLDGLLAEGARVVVGTG